MKSSIDKIIILSSLSILFVLFGTLLIDRNEKKRTESVVLPEYDSNITMSFEAATQEEETCIMYAKQSIGRYYITAYSDLETGSKLTASGKKVHEGTITTCAIDRKLHKFGTIFEIDGKLYIAEDTGGAVKGKHVDIFIHDMKKMSKYGSNHQEIYVVSFPFGKPE